MRAKTRTGTSTLAGSGKHGSCCRGGVGVDVGVYVGVDVVAVLGRSLYLVVLLCTELVGLCQCQCP